MSTADALRLLVEEAFGGVLAAGPAPFSLADRRTLVKVIAGEIPGQGFPDLDGHESGAESG